MGIFYLILILLFVAHCVAQTAMCVTYVDGCYVFFRDSDRSLDIFDEKLHPLSVSMLRFLQARNSKSLDNGVSLPGYYQQA